MSDVHEFGPFRLELSEHRVLRQGELVPLTPKMFLVLVTLVERRGHLVTRSEIIARVWPDVVVEEGNLSSCISLLRKALGDDVVPHRYIETVPKLGYRFVAATHRPTNVDVTTPGPCRADDGFLGPEASSASDVRRDDLRAVRPRLWHARSWRGIAGASTLAGLVVAYGALAPDRNSGQGMPRGEASRHLRVYGTTAVPLTAYRGWEGSPSLSPDGTQVAFMWDGADRGDFDIHVKLAGDGEPVRLTGDPRHEVAPAWSPDGSRIAFLRIPISSGAWDLVVMPALGGTERHVESLRPLGPPSGHRGTNWMSWTPDGRWLAVGAVIDDRSGIWLVEVDGPGRRRLTDAPPGRVDRSPRVSDDGRRVAFIRGGPAARAALLVMPLGPDFAAVGPPRVVVDPWPHYVGSIAWGVDQSSLVFSVGGHMGMSRLQLVRLASDGMTRLAPPEPLPFGEQATGLDITRSGRLVYVRQQRDTGFWTLDLEHPDGGLSEFPVLVSSFDEHTPHISPDGRRLAFASTRSGSEEIWIAGIDGSNPRQMTTMGGPSCFRPQWSPNGRRIVFASTKEGSSDLYLLDPETASIWRLTKDQGWEGNPTWSRDGRWIYFGMQADEHARSEIFKMSPDGGSALQVTRGGGFSAEESENGRALYVTRSGVQAVSLWRVPLDGGQESQVADDVAGSLNFVVGRQRVYFLAVGQLFTSTSIGAIDIATGRRVTLASLGNSPWWGMTLSPDERRLLVSAVNHDNLDLMLVDPSS